MSPSACLAPLVVEVDARHQVGAGSAARGRRRRRGSAPGRCGGSSPTRSRSARSPAGRNLYGARQAVADLAEQQRLRRQDPADRCPARSGAAAGAPRSGTCPRARRVTPSAASRARSSPPALSVNVTAMICVGLERAGRNLVRDAPRDRRRLAGSRAREDADGPAHRLGRAPLLGVQAVERVHRVTVPAHPAGNVTKEPRPWGPSRSWPPRTMRPAGESRVRPHRRPPLTRKVLDWRVGEIGPAVAAKRRSLWMAPGRSDATRSRTSLRRTVVALAAPLGGRAPWRSRSSKRTKTAGTITGLIARPEAF